MLNELDDIESDLMARALLHGAASEDFDQDETRLLLELRERVRLPFSLERARRVVAGDMDTCDGLGG